MAERTTDTGQTLTPVGRAVARSERKLDEAQQANAAYRMRMSGASLFAIAEQLSITEDMARRHISDVTNEVARLVDMGAKQNILTMELTRLDQMQLGQWPAAEGGDPKAVETVLKIMQHRAKLLGLDSAMVDNSKQTVVIAGDTDSYLAAIKKAMGQ